MSSTISICIVGLQFQECFPHNSISICQAMVRATPKPLDLSRAIYGVPVEDPRASGWPCQGNHDPTKVIANGSMQMKRCSKCNVECEYIPRQGAAGNPRKLDADPAIVSAALHRLQTEEVTAEIPNHS